MVRTCLSQNLEIMVQIGEARLLECNRECWIGVACWGNENGAVKPGIRASALSRNLAVWTAVWPLAVCFPNLEVPNSAWYYSDPVPCPKCLV